MEPDKIQKQPCIGIIKEERQPGGTVMFKAVEHVRTTILEPIVRQMVGLLLTIVWNKLLPGLNP